MHVTKLQVWCHCQKQFCKGKNYAFIPTKSTDFTNSIGALTNSECRVVGR